MINMDYDPDRLSTLILDALESPGTVDSNELLTVSNDVLDFLDTRADDELIPFGRAMAAAAMEWAVMQGDQMAPKNTFRACYMAYTTQM